MTTLTPSPRPEYVVCIDNTGYPVSLELHKIYRTLPDADAKRSGDLRVIDESGEAMGWDYDVIGEPVTVDAARALANDPDNEGRYQFEWWALSLIGAKPIGGKPGSRRGKKGADGGGDGIINLIEEDAKGKPTTAKVLVQVKSGRVSSGDIRDLQGVIQREGAAIGVFISLEAPTQAMLKEALAAAYYESPGRQGQRYRKIQILTIGELFGGSGVDMPARFNSLKRAQFYKSSDANDNGESQQNLFGRQA